MIQVAITIFLWATAGVFAISDILCLMALYFNRDNREFLVIIGCVALIFTAVAAAAVYGALALREMFP